MEGTFHLSNLWAKAYERVQDGEHAGDLKKFEDYLQKQPSEAQQPWAKSNNQDGDRLKCIQIMAKERLETLPEARTSFTLGGKRIVVRQHIEKAIQTIKQFKPIISGALSAEPQAALAWACILGVLPILESLFQKDEDAADGLTKIFFLLVRYQNLEESVLTQDSEASSQTTGTSTHELLSNIETKLIDIYEKVYLYQIRFVLQYGQGKWRRNMGGLLNPEDWKQKWKEIDTSRQLVDQAVQDRVGARTFETWVVVEKIETTTTKTLNAVQEMDARMKEMDIKEQVAQVRELLLQLPIAADAAFDSAKVLSAQSVCLQGTQHDILCQIGDWAEDPSGELIFWLYSMAGTGKSSIALTVADALKQRRPLTTGRDPPRTAFLGASFFFKQVDNTRNGTQCFFTTIAWSLAEEFDDFKPLVAQAIDGNLTIGTKAPQQQMQHLLVDTLSILDCKALLPIRLIVVVDALDECLDRGQAKELISLLTIQLNDLQRVQLRFLITSRREEHIQQAFGQLQEGLHRAVALEKIRLDEEGDKDDITRYIQFTLSTIARRHGCEDDVLNSTVTQLSEKANGLFIYAATACRFLDAGDFADPLDRQDRLDLILETSPATDDWGEDGPQNHIDDIYSKVLSFPAREKLSPGARRVSYEIMKNALGFLVTVFQPVAMSSLKNFVQCAFKGPENMAERLERLLKKLQAILTVPTDKKSPIELMHLSFRDFILSKERTQHLMFQVDESEMHKKALFYCLSVMSDELRQDICGLKWPGTLASEISTEQVAEYIQPHLRYVCQYWVDHLAKLDQRSQREVGLLNGGQVHIFLQTSFLYWLEVLVLIKRTATAILAITKLQDLIGEVQEQQELSVLIHDMRRFTFKHRWIIDQAPLQIYTSALVFSPKSSLVRDKFQSHIPSWIVQQPMVDDQWSPEVSALIGHKNRVTFVACSPVADLVVSLSWDKTARIWDTVTGTERFTFNIPHNYRCAAFSPNGKSIAFGRDAGLIDIRDFSSGIQFEFDDFLEICSGNIRNVIYSPKTGSMIAAWTDDWTFQIWSVDECDASLRHLIRVAEPDDHSIQGSCQFTPNEQYLVVAGSPLSMTMWDTQSGHCVRAFERFDTGLVRNFTMSSDGSTAALLTLSGTIMVLNLVSGELEVEYPGDKYEKVISSSDGTSVLVQRNDKAIVLLNAANPLGLQLFSSSNMGNRISISCDRKLLVSGDSGTMIRLWDIQSNLTLGQELIKGDKRFDILSFSPERTLVYGYSCEKDNAQIRDLAGTELALPQCAIRKIRFSPDDKIVALGVRHDNHGDNGNREDKEGGDILFELWDGSMTTQVLTYKDWKQVFFSPDGRYLALVPIEGEAEIVHSATFERVMTCQHSDIHHMVFSPDGQIIAFLYTQPGSSLYVCEVWSVLHNRQLYRTSMERESYRQDYPGILFSPDCNSMAFVSGKHDNWKLLDLATGETGAMIGFCDPVFHPQSHILAIRRDSGVDIIETSSLVPQRYFKLADDKDKAFMSPDCPGMAFSPSGKFVSTHRKLGKTYTIIQQWDIASGSEIGRYVFRGEIYHLSLSDDTYLRCDQGRLPLPMSNPNPESRFDGVCEDSQDLLHVENDWICLGFKKLMWVPVAYRAKIMGLITFKATSQIRGNTLALSHENGNICIMRFDLSAIPVR